MNPEVLISEIRGRYKIMVNLFVRIYATNDTIKRSGENNFMFRTILGRNLRIKKFKKLFYCFLEETPKRMV